MGGRHLPGDRAAECLVEAFGAPASTGWLASLLPAAVDRLIGFLAVVHEQLASAQAAHFDEAGARVSGRWAWVHVASSPQWTVWPLSPVHDGHCLP